MQGTRRSGTRPLLRTGIAVGAIAVLAAGCSSSKSSTASTSTSASAPAAATSAAASPSTAATSSAAAVSSSAPAAVTSSPAVASSAPASTGGFDLAPVTAAVATFYKATFTAPPTTAPAHTKNVKLWIISCGQESPGCAGPVAAAKTAAGKLGWTVNVFDGNFGIGDAYNSGLRQAVAAKATAIITVGVDCNAGKTGYLAAKAAKIPTIGANSFDCNDPAINDGPSLFSATTMYNPTTPTSADIQQAVGKAKADWIIAHTDGKAQVINLNFAGLTGGIYTNKGFVTEMATCTTCKIVKTINFSPTDTSNGNLKQEFATALAAYPNANAATVLSDGIILQDALSQAIQSSGRTKTFAMVGEEGFAPNVALVAAQNGEDAGATYDSAWVAWGAVDTTIRVLAGQPAVDEGMGVLLWDSTHNLPAAGSNLTAPVPYAADYEKAWGVS